MSKFEFLKPDKSKLFASVALGLVFAILMSLACFDARCEEVRDNLLRLHILANSDSEADQSVKLKVRDALLEECSDLFEGASSIDEAAALAKANLPRLQKVAQEVLKDEGMDYGAAAEVAPTDFNTREYGELTVPAGEYLAVQVLLGEGQGQNWWCVCFPNICLGSAAGKVDDALDKSGQAVVKGGQKFKVKFKIVEIYEMVKAKLKNT